MEKGIYKERKKLCNICKEKGMINKEKRKLHKYSNSLLATNIHIYKPIYNQMGLHNFITWQITCLF